MHSTAKPVITCSMETHTYFVEQVASCSKLKKHVCTGVPDGAGVRLHDHSTNEIEDVRML